MRKEKNSGLAWLLACYLRKAASGRRESHLRRWILVPCRGRRQKTWTEGIHSWKAYFFCELVRWYLRQYSTASSTFMVHLLCSLVVGIRTGLQLPLESHAPRTESNGLVLIFIERWEPFVVDQEPTRPLAEIF